MFSVFQALQIILGTWMWTLLGMAILVLFMGHKRFDNPIYKFMGWVVWPVTRFTRLITPRVIVDTHIPLLSLLVIFVARIGSYMLFYSQGWIPPVTP
ncbi:MAG: hypothetical protein ACLGHI_02025 [Gammaproteobacteria bacterium]|jgi:hypothetical protein